jgi:hypothetical protein
MSREKPPESSLFVKATDLRELYAIQDQDGLVMGFTDGPADVAALGAFLTLEGAQAGAAFFEALLGEPFTVIGPFERASAEVHHGEG